MGEVRLCSTEPSSITGSEGRNVIRSIPGTAATLDDHFTCHSRTTCVDCASIRELFRSERLRLLQQSLLKTESIIRTLSVVESEAPTLSSAQQTR